MPEIAVQREDSGTQGRYVARIPNVDGEAELIFTRRGPHVISADHTGAPNSMRGTGAAMALLGRMIADARNEGFKIIPLCPYVQAQFEHHPDWSDVMAAPPS